LFCFPKENREQDCVLLASLPLQNDILQVRQLYMRRNSLYCQFKNMQRAFAGCPIFVGKNRIWVWHMHNYLLFLVFSILSFLLADTIATARISLSFPTGAQAPKAALCLLCRSFRFCFPLRRSVGFTAFH
jgi:hypothetical protein